MATKRKEPFLTSLSTPYNRAHHNFAVFTAGCTFLLIIAGALVTSNDAGLSVPDWPTSFGSLYRMPAMVGGVRFEHAHRMVAEFIGVLTIILALWTAKVDRRAWMRKLGFAALGTIVAQGVLGGITVLYYLPPWISTAHATLGQTFFCMVVAMALFTGRRFLRPEPRQVFNTSKPSLPTLTVLSVAVVYLQLILGAAFRHSGIKLLPHLISAVVVTGVLMWTITRVLTEHAGIEQLRRPALVLLGLLFVQLSLGFGAYLTRVVWSQDAPQPIISMVVTTVSHVAVGALLLATCVVLAIEARRHIAVPSADLVVASPSPRQAVTA